MFSFNSNAVVEKIHTAFDTAEDRLLQQAKSIIGELENKRDSIEVDDKKTNTLKILGFVNTKTVKEIDAKTAKRDQLSNQIKLSAQKAELIMYYKQTYPFLKFLTEKELDNICTKYKLIYAPVKHYLEDVPDKNLQDIKAVQPLKGQDIITDAILTSQYWRVDMPNILFSRLLNGIGMTLRQATLLQSASQHTIDTILRTILIDNNIMPNDEPCRNVTTFFNQEALQDYRNASASRRGISWDITPDGKWNLFNMRSSKNASKEGLYIAAPRSHFDLKGLEQKGLGWHSMRIIEPKDPIVFRYCRGGIQVLTKWGLEAQDEALTNETLN